MIATLQQEYRRQVRLMGSAFEFVVLADDDETGEELLDASVAEVKRIECLLTEFSETSQTSLINRNAGLSPVEVEAEVYDIIKRCKQISAITQGAFDITSGLLKKMYNFKGQQFTLPTEAQLNDALKYVGFRDIKLLEGNRVQLAKPNMHIGFGAIGKGYAADKVKTLLVNKGVSSAVINASGDLTAWGTRLDGKPWRVGIANPDDTSKKIASLPIEDYSVATSGDYERYFELDGVRYSHTINPKTGKPVTGIRSVTIVSPSAELSDALATSVTVMGAEIGLHFIEQLPNTHCLIVADGNKILTSKHLAVNMNPV
jgi:thiamine biosynthesis lipoprotein